MSAHKSMPMTKEEVMQLVNLVEAHPAVFSKATNASNNQLKDSTWATITDCFNSVITSSPRRPEQLRLKWENLKKAARKRSTRIRMNSIKTGGGKPDYIPPDEALDKVASILGPTCDGYTVEFGGDAVVMGVQTTDPMVVDEAVVSLPIDLQPEPLVIPALSPHTPKSKFLFSSVGSKGKLKRQTTVDEVKMSTIHRNKAIAGYYESKKRREEELHQIKKRKMEIEIEHLEGRNCGSM